MKNYFDLFIHYIARPKIEITPNIEEDDKEDSHSDTEFEITFNGFGSFNNFRKEIQKLYIQVCTEIEKASVNYELKGQYINFLRSRLRIAEEVKYFYQIDSNINSIPDFLTITNVDTDDSRGEFEMGYFKKYFQLQSNYLNQLINSIKDLLKITLKLKSSEISLNKYPLNIGIEPTPDRPLSWFNYLISKNGISQIRNDFMPEEVFEGQYTSKYPGTYQSDTESYFNSEYDFEDDEHYEYTIYFKEELKKPIASNLLKTLDMVELKLNSIMTDKETVSQYLMIQLNDLKGLIKHIPKNQLLSKYEIIKVSTEALLKKILEKYSSFLSDKQLSRFPDYYEVVLSPYSVEKLDIDITTNQFVNFFAPLISSKKISINTNTDNEPIYRALSGIFNIKKERGTGFIKDKSLEQALKKKVSNN